MLTLSETFPDPEDLLSLQPEDLASFLIELPDGLSFKNLMTQVRPRPDGGGYAVGWLVEEVELAIIEALSWLETQGVVIRNPEQPARFQLTRRGRLLRNRTDLKEFRKGRLLPLDLLQPSLAAKVHHLFVRGDHDTAVFQAFKEVEVAVRQAGNYPYDLVGRDLMRKAFHPESGPLRDKTLVSAEREAEMHLFSGAIGHAKNPSSHRDVNRSRQEAAGLIVFASHLLAIVEERSTAAPAAFMP